MTACVEDDIVRRALLGLLMPQSVGNASGKANCTLRVKRRRPAFDSCDDSGGQTVRVNILDKLSSVTISVYWSDPCSGHYAEQIWRMGFARIDAACVLTGTPIRRGDPVFRPHARATKAPANAGRMILASAVPGYA
ncbi:MAG TPA: DUF3331 domain-containing protein [Paraburkholderia sp.]|jgi:hypothetical protein|nr:DUF3331 domain-containing protein [Paraburkholderia sp.]